MLQDFQNVFNFSITVDQLIGNLFVAFLCGLLISILYRSSYRGPGYSMAFVNSLVVLAMITAVVIMVIGNNLARAFGLVGAMSIIRFRTALKETQDIVFVFFSLAIGMAAGVGLHAVSIAGTLFIGTTLFVLGKINQASAPKREFLLQFTFEPNGTDDEASYLPILKKYCRRNKVINTKSLGQNDELELSFYVDLKNRQKNAEFVRELKRTDGVRRVNLFYDEEQF